MDKLILYVSRIVSINDILKIYKEGKTPSILDNKYIIQMFTVVLRHVLKYGMIKTFKTENKVTVKDKIELVAGIEQYLVDSTNTLTEISDYKKIELFDTVYHMLYIFNKILKKTQGAFNKAKKRSNESGSIPVAFLPTVLPKMDIFIFLVFYQDFSSSLRDAISDVIKIRKTDLDEINKKCNGAIISAYKHFCSINYGIKVHKDFEIAAKMAVNRFFEFDDIYAFFNLLHVMKRLRDFSKD